MKIREVWEKKHLGKSWKNIPHGDQNSPYAIDHAETALVVSHIEGRGSSAVVSFIIKKGNSTGLVIHKSMKLIESWIGNGEFRYLCRLSKVEFDRVRVDAAASRVKKSVKTKASLEEIKEKEAARIKQFIENCNPQPSKEENMAQLKKVQDMAKGKIVEESEMLRALQKAEEKLRETEKRLQEKELEYRLEKEKLKKEKGYGSLLDQIKKTVEDNNQFRPVNPFWTQDDISPKWQYIPTWTDSGTSAGDIKFNFPNPSSGTTIDFDNGAGQQAWSFFYDGS